MATSAVSLQQFQQTAHQCGCQPGKKEETTAVKAPVLAYILPPDDTARTAVHHKMRPLVNELHVVEWCLGEEGHQRQDPYHDDTQQRKGIALP